MLPIFLPLVSIVIGSALASPLVNSKSLRPRDLDTIQARGDPEYAVTCRDPEDSADGTFTAHVVETPC